MMNTARLPVLPPIALDEELLLRGLYALVEQDAELAQILRRFGPPPLWAREPGFATLIHIILEQQVSLASARAAYERLLAIASPLSPHRFLELDPATLKRVGFSRQKAAYGRYLAEAIIDARLDLDALTLLEDIAVRAELTKIKGIGPWTANIYLLMALRRPDIWPDGDLALAVAMREVKGLEKRPDPTTLSAISEMWRPWRAVAARLLWHYYLCSRPRS